MLEPTEREIRQLHQFFEGWLSGTLPKTQEAFSRLESSLANAFTMVSPGAQLLQRNVLLHRLQQAHGSRPRLTISITNVRIGSCTDEIALATYEEWQDDATARKGRLSTVVFLKKSDANNGLHWLHVHETWLPPPSVPESDRI